MVENVNTQAFIKTKKVWWLLWVLLHVITEFVGHSMVNKIC